MDVAAQEGDLGAAEIAAYRAALEAEKLRPVAIVPARGDLAAPRVKDLAEALGATRARAPATPTSGASAASPSAR